MTFLQEDLPEDEALVLHHQIIVDKGQQLTRIDRFLTDRIPNATRTKVQTAIETEGVTVNGLAVKASYKIKPLDEISLTLPHEQHPTEILPENIPLDIRYEDDDLLVLHKPPGMVVHPAHGNWTGTLVNALVYHFQQLPTSRNGEIRPGLVHRIDKDTSGLMVIAKSELAMSHLAQQFFVHSIERRYRALVWGELPQDSGTITGNIARSRGDRRMMDVFPDGDQGKHAVTHYKVLKRMRYVSLVECTLETGRTHQIRVHFKHLGHPLFNDSTYGGDKVVKGTIFSKYKQFVENCFALCPRQALHATSLGFEHPRTKEWVYLEAPIPDDMQALADKWENYIGN